MKKILSFNAPNKNRDRQIDAIKFEVKKYIARERRKPLPENVDFWDFDCRIGVTSDQAAAIHLSEINKAISNLAATEEESFYLEVLAKPGIRQVKPKTKED